MDIPEQTAYTTRGPNGGTADGLAPVLCNAACLTWLLLTSSNTSNRCGTCRRDWGNFRTSPALPERILSSISLPVTRTLVFHGYAQYCHAGGNFQFYDRGMEWHHMLEGYYYNTTGTTIQWFWAHSFPQWGVRHNTCMDVIEAESQSAGIFVWYLSSKFVIDFSYVAGSSIGRYGMILIW